jgi:signal transduction histidine kinase
LAVLLALGLAGAITWYAVRDLSEKRRAERANFQSQKLTAIGQMSGAVAHDFNNLLAVLIACLNILERTEDPVKKKEVIGEGLAAAERGSKLINQLLSFARDKPIELGAVDLDQTTAGVRDLIVRSLGPGVTLDVFISPAARFVHTNATQFELVLLNLAVNARDAMPEGGAFSIHSRPSPERGCVDIVVRDTGIGMSEAVAARALEPFFTTKEDGKGTGLGLAQAHLLMEQSGGALLLETAPGKGAAFTLRLRASAPPSNAR